MMTEEANSIETVLLLFQCALGIREKTQSVQLMGYYVFQGHSFKSK